MIRARRFTLLEAIGTVVGLVTASAVLLTASTGFAAGGYLFAIAIAVAWVLMMCQASSFAELTGMMPTDGAIFHHVSAGLGRFFGLTAMLASYILVLVFAGPAETSAAGLFAQVNFPLLGQLHPSQTWVVGSTIILVFTVVNLLGVSAFARVELWLTAIMWLIFVAFSSAGIVTPSNDPSLVLTQAPLMESGMGPVAAVVALTALAIYLFVGVEYVTPFAPEMERPAWTVSRALFIGIVIIALTMLAYGIAMVLQVPNVDLGGGRTLLETPGAIPIFSEGLFGRAGRYVFGGAVLLASATTLNTMIAGASQIMAGMARDEMLPSIFGYVHPRFGTPWVSIITAGMVCVVGSYLIAGDQARVLTLLLAAVCGWVTTYLLVNVSLLALRWRRPDYPRPFRSPLVPLPQIVASAGMLVALYYVAPPGIDPNAIFKTFGVLMAISMAYAGGWLMFIACKPLFTPLKLEDLVVSEEQGKLS